MPPPMPLSGLGCWKRSGSQPGSVSSSAKRGRIASHAAAGDAAAAMSARTPSMNVAHQRGVEQELIGHVGERYLRESCG